MYLFEKNMQINQIQNINNKMNNLTKGNDNENNNSSNETSYLSNPSQTNKQNVIYKILLKIKLEILFLKKNLVIILGNVQVDEKIK